MSRIRDVLFVLVGAASACSDVESAAAVSDPFLPADLDALDQRARERIVAARAQVAAAPQDPEAWAELALIYEAERMRTLGLACLREVRARDPAEPRWPYREACMLAALGRLGEAAAAIEGSIALEPGYAPSHWRLGSYRFELGDLDAARRCFERAAEIDPSFPGGWLGLARVHLQREEGEPALAALDRARELDPGNAQARQLTASARRLVGLPVAPEDLPAARGDEAPAWNDPWEHEARAYREAPLALQAGQLLQQGEADEALAVLEQARASGADQGDLPLRFARAYLKLGRTQEAERELGALLAREPDNTHAHMLLARLREQQGDVAGSLAELETVLRLQPDHGPALAAQGIALYRQAQDKPDFEDAAASLTRAMELGSVDPEVHFTLGQALLALRRWDEAERRFRVLLEHVPAHGDAWAGLGRARLELGDLEGCAGAIAVAESVGVQQRAFLDELAARLEKVRERRARRAAGADAPGEEDRR